VTRIVLYSMMITLSLCSASCRNAPVVRTPAKAVVVSFAPFEQLIQNQPSRTYFGMLRELSVNDVHPTHHQLAWGPASNEQFFRSRRELRSLLSNRGIDCSGILTLRATYSREAWAVTSDVIPSGNDTMMPDDFMPLASEIGKPDVLSVGPARVYLLPLLPDGRRIALKVAHTHGYSLTASWPTDTWTTIAILGMRDAHGHVNGFDFYEFREEGWVPVEQRRILSMPLDGRR
jgi:hypothetical protein